MSIRDSVRLFGPAWIALLADADAASILGGLSTGEEYGYKLVWFVMMLSLPIFVIQEAAGRLGAVTNKGVGELIRDYYSKRISLLSIVPIFFVDFFTYLSEYVGIVIGSYLIGINPIIGLLIFFILHIIIVLSKKYEITEKYLVVISLLLILSSLFMIGPKLYFNGQDIFYFSTSRNFLFFLAVNVGAVVTPPCMLVYQSSATAIKYSGVEVDKSRKIRWVTLETLIGAIITELIIVFSEIIGASISGVDPTNPDQLLSSLGRIHYIFGITLISAGFLTLIVVSLSSAWGLLEALGKNNYKNSIRVYIAESIPAFIIVSIMLSNYTTIIDFALTLLSLSPIVITIPAILIGILVSNRRIMGEYGYTKLRSIIYFITICIVLIGGIIGILPI
ncbi:divalent metal cation transporter [Sulfolobus tengchongensis]|uniref:Divalent metal cation transporter n=1 Tax=Sulfolobus tengchongensis TaxID=207809 RepID=A0AAX4L1K6_9CREN